MSRTAFVALAAAAGLGVCLAPALDAAASNHADPMTSASQGPAGPAASYDPMAHGGAATGGYDPLAATRPPADAAGDGGADVERAPEFGNLPRGDGAPLVFAMCTGCHGLDIVKQQRMSDERWAYTLEWMVREQGMAKLPDEIEDQVLAYLTTHFSSER